MGAQRPGDRREHRIDAAVRQLGHHVAKVVDDIGVVAQTARHRVGTGGAVQQVVAGIARQHVLQFVADAVEVGRAHQTELLDVGTQRPAKPRLDRIGALVRRLGHDIAGRVDDIGVVAQSAGHRVDARAAVQHVVAAVAGQRVGEVVAGAIDRGVAGQDQVLDVGAELVRRRRLHQIGAAAGRLDDEVVRLIDHIGIVAQPARHRVGARAAVEQVVARIARQGVAKLVAGAGKIGRSRQRQLLDVGAQRPVDRREHRIDAAVRQLGHHVAKVVDDIGVVAQAARHRVRARATVQQVVAGIAGQHVLQFVAGAVEVGRAHQAELLDVGVQRPAKPRLDRVCALVRRLGHDIAGNVDDVRVVAQTARHRVDARAAIQHVVAAVAGQRVCEVVAGAIDRRGAGQDQVLDVGAELIRCRRLHQIGAAAGRLDDDVVRLIDDIGVVAEPARHRVRAGLAVEYVLAGIAEQRIVQAVAGAVEIGRAHQSELLEIGTQRPAEPGLDRVGALARRLGDDVAGDVDDIGVVAKPARHRVAAGSAVEPVVAARAGEDVLAGIAGQDIVLTVADAAEVGRALQVEILDVGGKRPVDRRLDRVRALACAFRDDIASHVDDIGIVAEPAGHRVGVGTAIQHVVAGVAGQHVRKLVAGAVDVGGSGENEILEVVVQREVHRRTHRVGTFEGELDNDIAEADDIGIVAPPAGQRIDARVASEPVVLPIAVAIDRARAGEREVFEIGPQRQGDRREDRVDSAAGFLEDDVADIVDNVGIVAEAADQVVGTETAVENVVAGVAGDAVIEPVARAVDGACEQFEVLDIVGERPRNRRAHRVDALPGGLDRPIPGIVDVVDVVTVATRHGIGAAGAIDHVVDVGCIGLTGNGCRRRNDVGPSRPDDGFASFPLDMNFGGAEHPAIEAADGVGEPSSLGPAGISELHDIALVAFDRHHAPETDHLAAVEHTRLAYRQRVVAASRYIETLEALDLPVRVLSGHTQPIPASFDHQRVDAVAPIGPKEREIADNDPVVAVAAVDPVGAAAAYDRIIAGIAGKNIIETVAYRVGWASTRQVQVLKRCRQRETD